MSIEKKNPPQIFGEISMTWENILKEINPRQEINDAELALNFVHDYYDRRMIQNIPNTKMAEDYEKVKRIYHDILKKTEELKKIIDRTLGE